MKKQKQTNKVVNLKEPIQTTIKQNVAQSVLEQIIVENIKPTPKWEFMLKDTFVWALFIANTVFGSIGFAITIFLMSNNEIVADYSLSTSLLNWIILSIPFVWILLTSLFIFVSFYNFKHTEEGYKFSVTKIFLANIAFVIFFGYFMYAFGISERLNTLFSNNVPYYNSMMDTRSQVWMRPDSGYLAGTISSVSNNSIDVRDFNGKNWIITITNAEIRGNVDLSVGSQIKILGTKISDTVFEGSEIRPWNSMGMGNGMGRGMMRNN
jgi:hypothetical protein